MHQFSSEQEHFSTALYYLFEMSHVISMIQMFIFYWRSKPQHPKTYYDVRIRKKINVRA